MSTPLHFSVLKDALTYRTDLCDEAAAYLHSKLTSTPHGPIDWRLHLQLFPSYRDIYHELFSPTALNSAQEDDPALSYLLPDRRFEDYLQPQLLHAAQTKTVFTAVAPNASTLSWNHRPMHIIPDAHTLDIVTRACSQSVHTLPMLACPVSCA